MKHLTITLTFLLLFLNLSSQCGMHRIFGDRNQNTLILPQGYEIGEKKIVIPVALNIIVAEDDTVPGEGSYLNVDRATSVIPSLNELISIHTDKLEFVLPRRDRNNYSNPPQVFYYGDTLITGGNKSAFSLSEQSELLAVHNQTPPDLFMNSFSVPEIEEDEGFIGVSYVTSSGGLPPIFDFDVSICTFFGNNDYTDTFYPELELSRYLVEHEMGHHNSISHPFDSNCFETDSVTQGDYCADTPRVLFAGNCSENYPMCSGIEDDSESMLNIMSYSHDCKDRLTKNQVEKMYRYNDEYRKVLKRSPAALPPDSCDMGSPYDLQFFGTTSQGNGIIAWRTNGYAVDYDPSWYPVQQIRGRELGSSNWLYFNATSSSSDNFYTKSFSNLQNGTAYEWQVRTTCAYPNDPLSEKLALKTPWSDTHVFVFNTNISVESSAESTIWPNASLESLMPDGYMNSLGQYVPWENIKVGQFFIKIKSGNITKGIKQSD